MSTVLNKGNLSEAERKFYQANGYVVPAFRFEGEALTRLQQRCASVLERNPNLVNKPIPNPACPSFEKWGIQTDRDLMEFCVGQEILDMVEDIVGPDIILWSNTIFAKPAEKGKRTPFHRDGEFWPLEPLQTTTLWIAVTESNRSNGCLRLVPGSHATEDLGRHHDVTSDDVIFGREIDDDQFDQSAAIDIELEAGQMVFFDVKMIHGANANDGIEGRAAFTARYMPSTTYFNFDRSRPATIKDDGFALVSRPLFLLRGVDRANNDFSRNADERDQVAIRKWLTQ